MRRPGDYFLSWLSGSGAGQPVGTTNVIDPAASPSRAGSTSSGLRETERCREYLGLLRSLLCKRRLSAFRRACASGLRSAQLRFRRENPPSEKRSGEGLMSPSAVSLLAFAASLFLAAQTALAQPSANAEGPDRWRGPDLWFSPGDDLEVSGVVAHPDYPALFTEPSPWPTGLGRVQVMQLRAPYIARKPAESAADAAFLKAHFERRTAGADDQTSLMRQRHPLEDAPR